MRARGRGVAGLLPAAAIAILVAGCAGAPQGPLPHPLAEQVLRSDDRTRLDPATLFDLAAAAQVVLLGEKHDNPRHHELELQMLRELVARGRRPAIGLEVFDTSQSGLIMGYVAGKDSPHARDNPDAQLRAALGWDGDSDERWQAYGPLLRFAREEGLTVFGADLPVALRRRIATVGIPGLTGVEREQIPDTPAADATYLALTRERIREAHCGYGSDEYLGRLVENWTARNESMARAVAAALAAGDGEPVVLVVGWGHLRNGHGVPERIARLAPRAVQLNLGLRELHPDHTGPDHYVSRLDFEGRRFEPDHPYVWFTAPLAREERDLCAVFRKAGHSKSS